MKKMEYIKRFLYCALAGAMLLSFCACGKSEGIESVQLPDNKQQTVLTDSNEESQKILIVYFTAAENSGVDAVSSASYTTVGGTAVGRVRAIADMIQKITGGELFSIKTANIYPADGGKLIDQAADEQNKKFRPELTTHIENLNDYGTIFVGFPNWWYDMPMALYSFFEEYDFSGKTIIPFNVHNGSRFSSTISTIQKLEPDASVITEGFTVSERNVSDAEKDVAEWLNKIGFTDKSAENKSNKAKPVKAGKSGKSADDSAEHAGGGFVTEQVLNGVEGAIHYSYYLPKDYNENRSYPLMVVMPGYDMMWFGEESSGKNLSWNGFRAWTNLSEDMIVVSAQLMDWGRKSARQAIELTEYFLENFAVDRSRIYAAGYSAGGETMSQAVSMRPELYAAYLHGASQWDGEYDSVAENETAVYIYMAENDEYYGSTKAVSAYNNLYEAYKSKGYTNEQIDKVLKMEIPDNEYFNNRGIHGNYHGGGNILFDDKIILNWIISKHKG